MKQVPPKPATTDRPRPPSAGRTRRVLRYPHLANEERAWFSASERTTSFRAQLPKRQKTWSSIRIAQPTNPNRFSSPTQGSPNPGFHPPTTHPEGVAQTSGHDKFLLRPPEGTLNMESGFATRFPATVQGFLPCGDLACGLTRLQCPDCGHERLLAFTCKGRHFCPSCHQRRSKCRHPTERFHHERSFPRLGT